MGLCARVVIFLCEHGMISWACDVCVLVTFFFFSDFQIDHVYECMRECYDFML
jgi:hypothetical protein